MAPAENGGFRHAPHEVFAVSSTAREATPIERHNVEIQRNAEAWKRKPLLRAVYHNFYAAIKAALRHDLAAPTLELGSGIGAIKEQIPQCVTSDIFPNPWLDRVENAYELTFGDASLANLILFDVWHHLRYPGLALQEAHRVLKPGGRLVVFDPAMGLLGRIVYGMLHPEPLGFDREPQWFPPAEAADLHTYYAAQGNAWRMFYQKKSPLPTDRWQEVSVATRSALSYIASGGFSGPQLYPSSAYNFVRRCESLLDRFPLLFATRMLVVLEKRP